MSDNKSVREIIDRYSPIVRGCKGLLGFALKLVARPVEAVQNAAGAAARYPLYFGYRNTAGQSVADCAAIIPKTFGRMEKKLQASFNAAAAPASGTEARENFLRLADEVRRDGETLSTHCTIFRQDLDLVTEKYRFILATEPLGNREVRMTTLEEGVAAVKQQLADAQAAAAEQVARAVEQTVAVRRKPLEIRKPQPGQQQNAL
jgi:hypothetical protein